MWIYLLAVAFVLVVTTLVTMKWVQGKYNQAVSSSMGRFEERLESWAKRKFDHYCRSVELERHNAGTAGIYDPLSPGDVEWMQEVEAALAVPEKFLQPWQYRESILAAIQGDRQRHNRGGSSIKLEQLRQCIRRLVLLKMPMQTTWAVMRSTLVSWWQQPRKDGQLVNPLTAVIAACADNEVVALYQEREQEAIRR